MGFWNVLGWLCVFIIGSLIVTFLVTPTSFNVFKNNLKSISLPTTGNAIAVDVPENEVQLEKIEIIHSGKKKITYNTSEDCFSLTKNLIDKSFISINDAMNNKFDFIKVNDSADIIIYCHPYKYDTSPNYHYCDNEYCYTESSEQTIGLSNGNLIEDNYSIIDLYTGSMGLASIEHEIIHSLGYKGHSVYGYSVMSSYSDPSEDQYIDNETINKLKELYP